MKTSCTMSRTAVTEASRPPSRRFRSGLKEEHRRGSLFGCQGLGFKGFRSFQEYQPKRDREPVYPRQLAGGLGHGERRRFSPCEGSWRLQAVINARGRFSRNDLAKAISRKDGATTPKFIRELLATREDHCRRRRALCQSREGLSGQVRHLHRYSLRVSRAGERHR